MQGWSLERKIRVTQTRIMEWYMRYDGQVFISFSGGKDSTVLLDLARRVYPDIPAVYVDTGLEYPELRDFVKTKDNVIWLRPRYPFTQILEKYGYPIISKEVSDVINGARKGQPYGGDFLAVDPLTAKILAKVAMQAATDSESRKRILFMILAPVLGLLLLIAFILYLITSPFSVLSQWLIGDEVSVVEDFQKEYGYNQQLGIYEKDYVDGSGQSYEGVIFTDGATEVVYYNQLDERWADLPYGTDNIGGYGCGPTSMAIVVSSLTDQTVDPPTMAEWAYQNGYWCSGNGSYHSLIPGAAEGFGLQWESISTDDPQAVVDALASGKLIVALMSKGHFTSSGHFMVLRGVTSEGKILVADPASKKRSEQEWDISIILDEARKGAAAGGPLWAIY